MNYQRGLIRLIGAIAVLWSAFWIWTYYDAGQRLPQLNAQLQAHLQSGLNLEGADYDSMRDGSYVSSVGARAFELESAIAVQQGRKTAAVQWGGGGLIGLLLAVLIGIWVYRGMRKPSPDPKE